MNRLVVYFIIYIILLSIVGIYLDKFTINDVSITKSHFIVGSLIIPLLLFIQWAFETLFEIKTTTENTIVGKVLGILFTLSIVFVILFYTLKFTATHLITNTFIIVGTFLIIVGLLMSIPQAREVVVKMVSFVKSYLEKGYDYIGLFIDIIKNIELSKSQKITYGIVSLIIIILLIAREYSSLIKGVLLPKHKTLMSGPKYLNNELTIGTTENINTKHKREIERNDNIQLDINYNYATSCFVYLNPQGQNTRVSYNKFTKILDFGENPTLYFNNKTNQLKLDFYIDDTKKKDVIIQLDDKYPLFYQKWNTVVLNVNGGDIDVFLNGNVIHHQQITNKYKIEKITIGENKGLEGGIKNVVFYNKPLRLYQVHLLNYITD